MNKPTSMRPPQGQRPAQPHAAQQPKQEQAAPQAQPQQQARPAQESVPVADFRALQEQNRAMQAQLQQMAESVRALTEQRLADQQLPDPGMTVPVPPNPAEITRQKMTRTDERIADAVAKLAEGPRKFRCQLSGTHSGFIYTVGAVDEAHASTKFQQSCGIRAITDPARSIEVQEIEAAA